ncbi:RE2, partial [Symbiodinium sp. KB8]
MVMPVYQEAQQYHKGIPKLYPKMVMPVYPETQQYHKGILKLSPKPLAKLLNNRLSRVSADNGNVMYLEFQCQGRDSNSVHGTGQGRGVSGNDGPQNSGTTPQQWLGATTPQDPMALIAGGVAQLQAAMLKQMSGEKSGDPTPEAVKPGTSTLPSLPSVKSETSSVDLLDWLELIEAPMSDLSDGSAGWWRRLRAEAAKAYDVWVVSGPIEKLGVTPVVSEELEDGRWSRVNSRAASMILSSLDETIRSELVSRRMTGSTTSIVFRLLTLYQPGGEEEKYRTLQQLQAPPQESEAPKAVEALRAWHRWLRRCRELNIQAPDPSLLVRGLNAIVKGVLERHSEASFRTNLVRSNLRVDTNPSYETVDKFYKHLMGECETPTSPTTTSTNKTVRIDDKPEVESVPGRAEGTSSAAEGAAPDLKEVLADVGKMLKAMSTANMKCARVIEAGFEEKICQVEASLKATTTATGETSPDGLLDSGASHAMRMATPDEYHKGMPIRVTLAGEDVKEMKQNLQGTVLVQEDAYALIKELEQKQVAQLSAQVDSLSARLEVMRAEERRSWNELIKDYAMTGRRSTLLRAVMLRPFTKDLSEDVQAMIVEGFEMNDGEKYLKRLPLTRRQRKSLLASKQWVVHLSSGDEFGDKDPFNVIPKAGKTILEINVKNSKHWNLQRKDGVYQLLLWAASQGKISDIVVTLSQETWPAATRNVNGKDIGDLRTRERPYGRDELPPLQQQRVNEETAEVARFFLLWMVAMIKGPGMVGFAMDMFAGNKEGGLNYDQASLWETEMWKAFKSISGMSLSFFRMGDYGHRTMKPTLLATNYPLLVQMNDIYYNGGSFVPDSLVDLRERKQWCLPYKMKVATAIVEFHEGNYASEEELVELGVRLGKLTKDQKKATGYKHTRRKNPALYSLALDLAGPFKQKGRDMDNEDYKYILVAAYRCPREYLSEKALDEVSKKTYVPDEDDDPGDGVFEVEGEAIAESPELVDDSEGEEPEAFGPEPLEEAVKEENFTACFGGDKGDLPAAQAMTGLVKLVLDTLEQQEETQQATVLQSLGLRMAYGDCSCFFLVVVKGIPRQSMDREPGPTADVKRGHLIMREDGGLTVATSVKFNVVSERELYDLLPPAIAEGLPEDMLEAEQPPTKSQLKAEIEFIARKLYDDRNFDLEELKNLYDLLEALGHTDSRISKKSKVTSWYTGAFVHGGVAGLRSNMKEFPYTSKYVTSLARHYGGTAKFSAVGLAKNAQLGLHRDSHNSRMTRNYVIPVTEFEGGSLWVQEEDVQEGEKVEKQLPNGKVSKGKILKMDQGQVMEFSPRAWHEVQPWAGTRLVLLMFTPRATRLKTEDVEVLEEVGFPVDHDSLKIDKEEGSDEEEEQEPIVKVIGEACSLSPTQVFDEVDDEEMVHERQGEPDLFGTHNSVDEVSNEARLYKFLKKAEVQYTPNIEDILKEHDVKGTPLEVTHTVSLGAVKRDLEKWKDSAWKEYKILAEKKSAFKVVRRSDLPPGCRVVPCKGVYTVKPDQEGLYRRKTRFVACGNYISGSSMDIDLFAAGIDATSVRTMLAFNTNQRKWKTGVTDIRQAFVLARWKGTPVALEPPGIAYELGIAQRGDMWLVQQAIYGLRESPALWSSHRDNELRQARWTAEIEGKQVNLCLQQLVSDNQIWRIVDEENPQGEPHGYLMVYIDDLLIQAQEPVMNSFFQWVAAKWECDALNVLEYDNSIRFLGMEVHKKQGGIELSQEGFINELLRSYGHKGTRSKSQGSRETLLLSVEEEEAIITGQPQTPVQEEAVKQAQKKVGEMLWPLPERYKWTLHGYNGYSYFAKFVAAKASKAKLTKSELKELQRLIAVDPEDLQ